MPANPGTPSATIRSAVPLLGAMTILMMGSGLLGTILGIRASLERFPTTVIGLVMSAYYVGFLIGCGIAPRLLSRVARVPVFTGLAMLAAASAVVYPFLPVPAAWGAIRAVSGLATAGLYVVAESWLASTGGPSVRGRLLAVYLLVVNAGYGMGQALLGLGSPEDPSLFVVSAALLSASALPLLGNRDRAGGRASQGHIALRDLWRQAPLGIATSFVTGIGVGAVLGIGAVYATEAGMAVSGVGLFVGAAMAGGIVLQWPIGFASDHFNRRHVIITASLAGGAFALSALAGESPTIWQFVAIFGFTAFSFPLYSLAISHVNDALAPEKVVGAAAVLLGVYGTGTLLGPIATSLAMERMRGDGFWLVPGASHVLLGVYGIYRLGRRRRMLEAHHLPPLPIGVSPQAALLIEDTTEAPTIPR